DLICELATVLPRREAKHANVSRTRMQNPSQYLDRGRFSSAIRPNERYGFSGRNPETESINRDNFRDGSLKSAPTPEHKILFQIVDLDFAMHKPSKGSKYPWSGYPNLC